MKLTLFRSEQAYGESMKQKKKERNIIIHVWYMYGLP